MAFALALADVEVIGANCSKAATQPAQQKKLTKKLTYWVARLTCNRLPGEHV